MRETYNIKFRDILETVVIIYVLLFFRSYLSYEQITNLINSKALRINTQSVLEYLAMYNSDNKLEYNDSQKSTSKSDNKNFDIDYINSTLNYKYDIKFTKIDISNYIVIFVNLTIFSIIYTIYNRSRKKYIVI